MRLETILESDLLAHDVKSIGKVRELVLELAVKGRLVPQEEVDQPGSSLLKLLESERTKLVAAKKIRLRTGTPLGPDDQPFHIPSSWAWARLSDVGHELGQCVPNKRFAYIDVGVIDSAKGRISDRIEYLEPNSAPSRARKRVEFGTVIYSTVRPYLLNIAVVEQKFDYEPIASTAFGILHPFPGVDKKYLFYWLRSVSFTNYVLGEMKGMAYPAINDEKFYNGPIPLPPLAEQKRIVTKVDELMAVCDQLEEQLRERDTQQAALARASLARFAKDPTPANLEFLFHQSFDINPVDLRKAILTLAVQGKLVHQDPSEEPGDHLFSRMRVERERMTKDRSIRRVEVSPVNSDEWPANIPSSWVWTRLGLVGDWGAGSTPTRGSEELYGGTITWLKSGELNDCLLLSGSEERVTDLALERCSFRINKPGDVLLAMYGATIGKAAILAETAVTNQAVCGCTPFDGLSSKYLFYYLLSQRSAFHQASEGGAQPNISKAKIINYPIPLPPYGEQMRIVAKIQELMFLVDQLEAKQEESRAKAEKLLAALVHEITAPQSPSVVAEPKAKDNQIFIHPSVFLAAEILDRLHDHNTFGQTKLQKVVYLAEYCLQLPEVESSYIRYQRGPYDPNLIDRIESGLVEHQWFEGHLRSEGKGRQYSRLDGDERYHDLVRLQWQDKAKEIRDLADMLRTWSSEECEIFATLFAAWNDFIIHGEEVTDEKIINEVLYNWHEEKQRISKPTWQNRLDWMKAIGFIPTGYGKPTKPKPQPRLF